MRQRNIKNLDQKIRRNSTFLVTDPESCRGRWREVFGNNAPVYLEIGCGKGRFIALRAAAFPEKNFIAVEGQSNVALRALQKAEICHFDNLRIFIDYVDDLGRYFEPGELAGIYLNFSDPWPKAAMPREGSHTGKNSRITDQSCRRKGPLNSRLTMTGFLHLR